MVDDGRLLIAHKKLIKGLVILTNIGCPTWDAFNNACLFHHRQIFQTFHVRQAHVVWRVSKISFSYACLPVFLVDLATLETGKHTLGGTP